MKRASITEAKSGLSDDSRLERLVRERVIRPARAEVPETLLATEPPQAADGASVVSALLDNRRSGS